MTTTMSSNIPESGEDALPIFEELPPLQLPPPLPPRRRTNTPSSSGSSDVFIRPSSPEPPQIPPRTDPDQPPPVPPRRDSMFNTNSLSRGQSVPQPRTPTLLETTRTVPPTTSRTQSVSQLPFSSVQNMQVHSATLPRCHGDRDSLRSGNTGSIFTFNGDNDIPALPPKTYRSHSRKQSS